MKIIDLSTELYDAMPVFPGDPEVEIKQVHRLETEGWNLHTLSFTSHIGTHVNVPWHMDQNGKKLDEYDLDNFMGECVVFTNESSIKNGLGVIFRDRNIDERILKLIIENKPKFVGLADEFDMDIEIERSLLKAGIINYESLSNTDQLPKKFMFYGVPLKLRGLDGSPVRAFAVA